MPSSLFFTLSPRKIWRGLVVGTWLVARMALAERSGFTPILGSPEDLGLFFDAEERSTNLKDRSMDAKGVTILLGDAYITAQDMHVLLEEKLAVFEGDVRIIRKGTKITASRAVFDIKNKETLFENVMLFSDPRLDGAAVDLEILGLTAAEVAFEISRQKRSAEMETELKQLRNDYVKWQNLASAKRGRGNDDAQEAKKVLARYAQILERLSRTKLQTNTIFSELSPEEREKFQKRRKLAQVYAAQHPESTQTLGTFNALPGYAEVRASKMMENADGIYRFEDVGISSCRCGPAAPHIWGFSTRTAEMEVGGYLTLTGATLDVLDVPVLYTPWFRFPIKTQRQTGLLPPSIWLSRSGQAVGEQLFVTLGDSADTTFGATTFGERGWRLENEVRFRLTNETQVTTQAEWFHDKKNIELVREANGRIDQEVEKLKSQNGVATYPDPDEIDKLNKMRGKEIENRWFLSGNSNFSIAEVYSLKFEGEMSSDNRYLNDLSRDNKKLPLDGPSQMARRFLTQEASAEYYGDDWTASVRLQGKKDLFLPGYSDAPLRLPLIELHLLPRKLFDTPIDTDVFSSWERVHRVGGSAWVDTGQGQSTIPGEKDETRVIGRNGRKDIGEVYVEGDRFRLVQRATLTLPVNPWVNASVSANNNFLQYKFQELKPFSSIKPWQIWSKYEGNLNVPVFGALEYKSPFFNGSHVIRNDFVPSVTMTYIPKVYTDPDFPAQSNLFYANDFVVSKQELRIDLKSSFSIEEKQYQETKTEIKRYPPDMDIPLADPQIVKSIILQNSLSAEDDWQQFLESGSRDAAPNLYRDWAQKELSAWQNWVQQRDWGVPMIWPESRIWRNSTSWRMEPLSLYAGATYNFKSHETYLEALSKTPVGERVPILDEPWSDVDMGLTWNLNPFLRMSGNLGAKWRTSWKRFSEVSASVGSVLPFGFQAYVGSTWSTERDPVVDDKGVTLPNTYNYYLNRTYTSDFTWNLPRWDWIQLEYQKILRIKQKERVEPEFEYESAQILRFIQLQDCMNIEFRRTKSPTQREYLAAWALSFNLTGFGQNFTTPDNMSFKWNELWQQQAAQSH